MTTRDELLDLLAELTNTAFCDYESLHKYHPAVVAFNKTFGTTDDTWISNIGRDKCGHPKNLSGYSLIEVKYRNGGVVSAQAHAWYEYWRETGSEWDIVAYRVLAS